MTRINVRKIPPLARGLSHSYAARLAVPMTGYGGVGSDGDAVITVGAVGFSFGSALRKATSIAKHITDDPTINSMLPPQAKAAISASRRLAKAAKRGRKALKGAWDSLPPGVKKKTKGLANGLMKKLKKKKKGRREDEAPEDEAPETEPEATEPEAMEPEAPEEPTPELQEGDDDDESEES